jgi:hypothetical protein
VCGDCRKVLIHVLVVLERTCLPTSACSPSKVLMRVVSGLEESKKIRRCAWSNKWGSLKQPVELLNCEPQTSRKSTPFSSVEVVMHCYH